MLWLPHLVLGIWHFITSISAGWWAVIVVSISVFVIYFVSTVTVEVKYYDGDY